MIRKNLYTLLVITTGLLLASIFIFAKQGKKTLPFRERKGAIALSAEWLDTKKAIKGLVAAVEADPSDMRSRLSLAQAYIQESRVTGEHGYYDNAALQILDEVLAGEPQNFDALCCKATVLLSQHHFAEGFETAEKALPLNPSSAFIYGLMCDAQLELGNYKEAVKMADKMVSIRPDMRSYARVSYLREIYGDLPGAISAAKLAVAAGYPGLEQTEWARMILAHLYEETGALDSMEFQCRVALRERPGYAFAIAGLGRVEKHKGNYAEAISLYKKAKSLITEYSFSDELTDLYRLCGESEKADRSAREVIAMLGPGTNADENVFGHGHYADKELAYACLKLNDTESALKHAMLEFGRRPSNIEACEAMAWVEYKMGDYRNADNYIAVALRTNCKNPSLLCHAGLIRLKCGKQNEGRALIAEAFRLSPFIADAELKKEDASYIHPLE
jgi:tetratricopeptide (TPR) repeat protein